MFDDLVVLHRGGKSGMELHRALHEVLLRVRPFKAEAFAFADELGAGGDAAMRASRADLLGEVGGGDPDFRDEALSVIEEMSADEQDAEVVASLAAALGKMWDSRTTPLLLRWTRHADDNVRFAVASALNGAVSSEANPVAVDALIELTRDPVPIVRDWATFGLGNCGSSAPEVVRALLDRIGDDDADTRAEAFMALAERRDDRIVDPLIAVLSSGSVGTLEVKAAAKLADVRLHEALLAVADWWGDDHRGVIEAAIRRCDPELRPVAVDMERRVIEDVVHTLCGEEGVDASVVAEGSYPDTAIELRVGKLIERWDLWHFDDDDPLSLDAEFTVRGLLNLARSLIGGSVASGGDLGQ